MPASIPNAEAWVSVRNDALDVFEIRNSAGRLVAMVPIGETAMEVHSQLRVRDLVLHSPALLGAAHWHVQSPNEASGSALERAVQLASGGQPSLSVGVG